MDESVALSSRSAAMETLTNLTTSYQRLLGLAYGFVDRLFPGDGTVRDNAVLPFANLMFIAVNKTKLELDNHSDSFAGVLKTLDLMRPAGAASPTPTYEPVPIVPIPATATAGSNAAPPAASGADEGGTN